MADSWSPGSSRNRNRRPETVQGVHESDAARTVTVQSAAVHGVYFIIISSNSLLVYMSVKSPQPG